MDEEAVLQSKEYALSYGVSVIIGATILFCIVIYHLKLMYSDFFTRNRRSTAHRRKPPPKTFLYTAINMFTLALIVLLLYTEVHSIWLAIHSNLTDCDITITAASVSYQSAKSCLYAIFLLRLRKVFQRTQFNLSAKCLNTTLALIIIIGLFSLTLGIIGIKPLYTDSGNGDKYPNYCSARLTNQTILLGTLLALQDFGFGIGFVVAFLLKLRKLLLLVKDTSIGNDSKVMRKILYAGTKTTMLTSIAVGSTLLAYVFSMGVPSARLLWMVDMVINAVCTVLMTDYYPDVYFYRRLCCCCIICCDPKKYSYDEADNDGQGENNDDADISRMPGSRTAETVQTNTQTGVSATSIDTADQTQATAQKVAPVQGAYTNVNEANMDEAHDRELLAGTSGGGGSGSGGNEDAEVAGFELIVIDSERGGANTKEDVAGDENV